MIGIQEALKSALGASSRHKKPRYSYSALDCYSNCPRSFYEKYVLKHRIAEQTLPLALGSLLHKVKELYSTSIMSGETPDCETLTAVAYNGWHGKDKANGEREEVLLGIDELKQIFADDWIKPDAKSGLTYEQKLVTFFNHLMDAEKDNEWTTIGCEVPFEFETDNTVLFGVIDKVEENAQGQLRIVDYKTSKEVYNQDKLATPLQMYLYGLACAHLYPDRDVASFVYDFVLLGEQREVVSLGWKNRAQKKLDKLLAGIEEDRKLDIWKPKPSPLCYYCQYCNNNPKADSRYNRNCHWYSLWTPTNKSYEVASKWDIEKAAKLKGFGDFQF